MSASDSWRALGEALAHLRKMIGKARAVNISARDIRDYASGVAQQYFQDNRAVIEASAGDELRTLDDAFQGILTLSSSVNRKSTYSRHLKTIQKLYPQITGKLAVGGSSNSTVTIGDTEKKISALLDDMVPAAGKSFKQALIDLTDTKRISYRGPAVELREALRETLDFLAPDEEVQAMDGYKQEAGLKGPTMKQKVRFILRARGMKDETAPEQAASAIEEMVGGFARSVYTMSNAGTHGSRERTDVMRIRRYVIVVLHDILAMPE